MDRQLEFLKEQIKYRTELLKLFVLVAVALGGGSLGLALGNLTVLRSVLAGAGIIGTVALVGIAFQLHTEIEQLTHQIMGREL